MQNEYGEIAFNIRKYFNIGLPKTQILFWMH